MPIHYDLRLLLKPSLVAFADCLYNGRAAAGRKPDIQSIHQAHRGAKTGAGIVPRSQDHKALSWDGQGRDGAAMKCVQPNGMQVARPGPWQTS